MEKVSAYICAWREVLLRTFDIEDDVWWNSLQEPCIINNEIIGAYHFNTLRYIKSCSISKMYGILPILYKVHIDYIRREPVEFII